MLITIRPCASTPDDASFPYLRGVARADAGDADGAIADFTKAIEPDPEVATTYVRRGRVYEAEGDQGRAAADYRSALQDRPVRRDGEAAPRSLQQIRTLARSQQKAAGSLEVGGRVDTERNSVDDGHVDAHAGFQGAQLLQLFAQFQR